MIPKMMLPKVVMVCGLVWSLSGCAEKVAERGGSSVDLVPLTYSLSLNITNENEKESDRKINHFIHKHWLQLRDQPIDIEIGSNLAIRMSEKIQSQLIENGVSPDNIVIHKQIESPDFSFNFTLSYQIHHVLIERCDYARVGRYQDTRLGCYADSARWHSMVHPEKMIADKNQEY